MGSLVRPWITRYIDPATGRQVRKGSPGARVVRERARKWYAQFKDSAGRLRRVPLASDKTASRSLLAELEKRAALGRAGIVDPFAKHRGRPIAEHVSDYAAHLKTKGVSGRYHAETLRRLRAILAGAGARTLDDLNAAAVERFLTTLADGGAGSGTTKTYLTSAKAFSRWCHRTRRMGDDPLMVLRPGSGPILRQRRALTEPEILRLLDAARRRPVVEAHAIHRGPRRGARYETIPDGRRERLERVGRERALMYTVLLLTGLRRGELAALRVCDLTLTGRRPCLNLPGSETKSGKAADLPLRADLAADLAAWIAETGRAGTDRVFRVPRQLVETLKADLKFAGIPYADAQGRTVDVHSLRHSCATFLARAKVSPRIAQLFMRHADIKLTMQTYTDYRMLDEAEALDALPAVRPKAKKGKRTG